MKILFHSNVLLRWNTRTNHDSIVVIAAIDKILASGYEGCFTSQNLGEYWNVLTRPTDRNGFGLTSAEADDRARAIERRLILLADGVEVRREWRRLLVRYSVSGVQVHDARIAASMNVHAVRRILTLNARDFARFADIEAVHPADLARTGARE
jgi:predicted nucleic acid-binding protein